MLFCDLLTKGDQMNQILPRLIGENVVFLSQVFQNKMVIPEFEDFCGQITEIFESCRENKSGKVADYIPQLAKYRDVQRKDDT